MRGIKQIQPTGNIFITSIPIGEPTKLATIMTRLFITATIMAKAGAGIADDRANHNRSYGGDPAGRLCGLEATLPAGYAQAILIAL
jgi:hypothetical protein